MRILLIFIALALSSCTLISHQSQKETVRLLDTARRNRAEHIFHNVIEKLATEYHEPIDLERWTIDTLNNGLQALDGHASLVKPHANQPRRHAYFGFEYRVRSGRIFIVRVDYGSPMWNAGLRRTDEVVAINGIGLGNHSLQEISTYFDEFEMAQFSVLRGKTLQELSVTKRRFSQLPPYELHYIGQYAYVFVANFDEQIAPFLKFVMPHIDHADGVIFDLRSNTGGSWQYALRLISYVLTPNLPIMRIGSAFESANIYESFECPVHKPSVPVVVLINTETASAGEMASQILKESKRALVIGEGPTLGLGTTMSTYELDNLDGLELSIPRQKYFGPTGGNINKIGVTPDLHVTETNPAQRYIPGVLDTALEAAVQYLDMQRAQTASLR
ncbi:MAG: S41 family peptidase [Patescibacteria group bacterium]